MASEEMSFENVDGQQTDEAFGSGKIKYHADPLGMLCDYLMVYIRQKFLSVI